MSEVFRFVLLGLGAGALYALLASGIVLIYRGSGVINFAQGAVGMVGTYVWWELEYNHGVPFAVALLAGLAASAAIGLLTHVLVMRPLRHASGLSRVIATLGVLVILQSLASLRYPNQVTVVPSTLPTNPIKVLGQTVGENQLLILAIAAVLIAVLWVAYRYTRFGLATTAVAENPRAASALAISPDRVAASNWILGSALAALAGILLCPISGLQVSELTLLVVPALTAAMVGGISSFPGMLIGGLLLGIVQSLSTRYITAPGWSGAIPFIMVFLLLVVRGRAIPIRGYVSARLPSIGTGRIRPIAVVLAMALYVVIAFTWFDGNWITALTIQMGTAIVILSVVVLTGYAGQLSLAQFTFAGLGALVAARLISSLHLPLLAAIAIAVVGMIPVGVLLGFTAVRTRGVNLAILTFFFAVAVDNVVFGNTAFLGGSSYTNIGRVSLFGYDIDAVNHPSRYAIFALVCFVLVAVVVANLRRGRIGRKLIAVRNNERAAASVGIRVANLKLYAFAVGAGIAGVGGIVLAFISPNVGYTPFSSFNSIYLVEYAIVGSIGWINGSVIGSSLSSGTIGPTALSHLGGTVQEYSALIGGVLLLLTVIFYQNGVAAAWLMLMDVVRNRLPRRVSQGLPAVDLDRPATDITVRPMRLRLDGVSVRYGGNVALDDVNLEVQPGNVVGLIGPNGAGKTTLIDASTGFTRSTGEIYLDDTPLSGRTAAARQQLGLSRTFQSLELFDDMTVLGNLRVASELASARYYLTDLVWPRRDGLNASALAAVQELGLGADLHSYPSELTYGKRRLVSIARSVACAPSVLLLDEPAAGLDDVEARELGVLIRRLAKQYGIAILLVEHHVELVLGVSDWVHVLEFGRTLAEGRPEEIRNNAAVKAAYFGTSTLEADVEQMALATEADR